MRAAGIAPANYSYADYIVSHEGSWCPTIQNGEVGCAAFHGYSDYRAYGVGQALPGDKMAPYGADWQTSPITQLRWMNAYVTTRYGGWYGAYQYWLANNNY